METISRTLEIDGKIEDVEIDVNVTHYVHVPSWTGSVYDCPSDEDWYGYTESMERYDDTEPKTSFLHCYR